MSMLKGKVILVTGASGGIGHAAARAFSKAGARVVLLDREAAAVEALRQELQKAGFAAEAVVVDVTDEAQVSAAIDAIAARQGRLDGAFNNAGIEQSNKTLHEISLDSWTRILSVDLTGVFLCMKHEVRVMLKGRGGSIVNTASALGAVAIEAAADYVAAKHGVIGVTRAAAVDYAKRGIRVNAVLPGIVDTPMIQRLSREPTFESHFATLRDRHPMGRFAKPEEIAESVAWLLSDASSFVTGACLPIDGGYLSV